MEDIRASLWNRFYGQHLKPYRDYYKVNENELVPSYDNTYDEAESVYRKIQDTDVTVDPLDLFYARFN